MSLRQNFNTFSAKCKFLVCFTILLRKLTEIYNFVLTNLCLSSLTLKLDQDTEFRLRLLRQKLEKQKREPVTFSQVIKFLLDEIEKSKGMEGQKEPKEFNNPKTQILKLKPENPKSEEQKEQKVLPKKDKPEQKEHLAAAQSGRHTIHTSRYIPTQVKKDIQEQYHGKCAYPNCNKPAEILHHIKRFALIKNQDSKDIKPLCKEHHVIAHATLIKNEQEAPKTDKSSTSGWELEKDITNNPAFYSKTRIIDEMTQNFREF